MRKPTEQSPYVFVYGTLMSGFGNNRLLKNSEFLDSGSTEDEFALFVNSIPFLLDGHGGTYVHGEIYKVDEKTLKNLDALEGHPKWYDRRIINVITEQGDKFKAWAYFMPKKPTGVKLISSGNYRDYTN